jgi:predicted transcriptional regulator
MLTPCEIAIKCILPSVRAMIAKELMAKHDLKQVEAAKLLGISQPAISLYNRKMRGRAIDLENDKEIGVLIENFAALLIKGNISHKDFIRAFCEVCRTIRAKGLMCKLHKAFDPTVNIEGCDLCAVVAAKCAK